MEMKSSYILLFAKDCRTTTVGMAKVAVFPEIRPGAGFKTSGFVQDILGGLS